MRVLVLFLPELLLMLLAFARLLILSTSLDIDDVFVLLSNWKKNLPLLEDNDDDREEEEEHKEFDDDTKNELRLEIVIKGRDFKEEEYAETPLNIYISFLCCFCVSCSSIQKLPSFIFRVLIQFLRLRKKKFSLQNVREKKQTKKNYNGGSITLINGKRFSANAGRATGSAAISTRATNSRYCICVFYY